MINDIEVWKHGVYVGTGLCFWDGENLRTDIVGLLGEILPPSFYDIKMSGESVLGVYAMRIQ